MSDQPPPPPPPPNVGPPQDTARYEAWIKAHDKPLHGTAREEVRLRVDDWGFFEHGRAPGDALDRLGLDRAGHILTASERGDWHRFLARPGLSALEALRRVAWLYRGGELTPKNNQQFRSKFAEPTLSTAADGSVTLTGWLFLAPGPPSCLTLTATPTTTTMKWARPK